jgi:hypothetical protein
LEQLTLFVDRLRVLLNVSCPKPDYIVYSLNNLLLEGSFVALFTTKCFDHFNFNIHLHSWNPERWRKILRGENVYFYILICCRKLGDYLNNRYKLSSSLLSLFWNTLTLRLVWNLISTFLILSLGRYLWWSTVSPQGYHPPSSHCFGTGMVY